MFIAKRVLNTLLVHQGGYVTSEEMIDRVFGSRRDGGPKTALSAISSAIRWLEDHGWRIVRAYRNGRRCYMIAWERQ